ncbi:glutathione S-transferase [Phyllosticta capitalensis]|uniref:Glutathione S-transferase n=1 Tax=Phyllosticta capitalensis TaxID=121624 RepID=A0ABR1YR82_9PEZI
MATTDNKKSILNWVDPNDKSGEFKRQTSVFRNWISAAPGAEFPPEKGRYHLYVSYACPWAHRTLIVRKIKGLEDIIGYTSVHWHMGEKGWRFATPDETKEGLPGDNVTPDPHHPSFTHLRDLYFSQDPEYAGRFTVPTLYDTVAKRIVSNESSEIIRMLYTEFDALLPADRRAPSIDLYPEALRKDIDEANTWMYDEINNGVYKSGFATTQEAYTNNVTKLFGALDRAEAHLAAAGASPDKPYYLGAQLTEVDVRLYTTIIRFDPVYVQHFKCNIRDIRSGYPHLHAWMRRLYWLNDAFGPATTQFDHIKRHYTQSHAQINPKGITPVGPLPHVLPLEEEVPVVEKKL